MTQEGQLVGYARVSSVGQCLELQREQLTDAGCTKIFEEKRRGGSREDRDQLAACLEYVREFDTLVVTRLDRLARSIVDLRQIVDTLSAKGCAFRALQQSVVDTGTSSGRLTLNMLAAFAEFENDLRRERQREGIEKAKLEGRYRGRPATLPVEQILELKAQGQRPSDIARLANVSRSSVYRALSRPPGKFGDDHVA
jgi:DNA invertase Pin-like site-specific DNA recombinase